MRFLSLTLRNYRVHKEVTITFDPARNLIGGPNESGKSTLVEAAHRALFLRAKTGGKTQKEMVSICHLGDPEISLSFETAGATWELEKRFASGKGSTLLNRIGEPPLKDDEAEARLGELLKSETASGGGAAKLLPTLWSHLWVWQGTSGDDPSGHASDHKDTLVQRLQQDGLAAVLQSANDQRVRERISATYEELFTATGKPKAGSPAEVARLKLVETEEAVARARETFERLEQAAADHERAQTEITGIDAVLPNLETEKNITEAKLGEVRELRVQEDRHQFEWQKTSALAKQLADADAVIRKLGEQTAQARDALTPAERMETSLISAEKEAHDIYLAAEATLRDSADQARHSRLRHDFAIASVTAYEKTGEHARLAARAGEADGIRQQIAGLREELSQLPPLIPRDLESLRQLDRASSQAEASLGAMAAAIELITTDLPVTLDGQPLTAGEEKTLTDTGELVIGSGTRLRIRPGGGNSLADARLQCEQSHRALEAAFDRHALRDLDHATAVLQQHQTLAQQIDHLGVSWKALGGENLVTELAAAVTAHEGAKAELKRRCAAAGSPNEPGNPEAALQLRATTRQALDEAEKTDTDARQRADQLRTGFETSATRLQAHRDQANQARQSLRDLETRLQVLQETHGETPSREAALGEARVNEQSATALLATTRDALALLNPELLAADLERFTRAISQQQEKRREAEKVCLIARDRLSLDGGIDPQADLSQALARHATALEVHASLQRRAQAVAQLQQLFSSSREAIDLALVQPLADRISDYLQCFFGPAAGVRINLSETGIEGLELSRADGSTFLFATLSGGAKEQVAAAVRLAIAEILAADHDGSLPILFDDAFAYTDPGRVQSLQRMLDLAARRGLQVIVLTCAPVDYSAFGARSIVLS